MTNAVIPDSVTTIGTHVFDGCAILASLVDRRWPDRTGEH